VIRGVWYREYGESFDHDAVQTEVLSFYNDDLLCYSGQFLSMIQEDKASILDIKLDHELTEPPAAFALLADRFERLPKDERLLTSSELAAGPSLCSGPLTSAWAVGSQVTTFGSPEYQLASSRHISMWTSLSQMRSIMRVLAFVAVALNLSRTLMGSWWVACKVDKVPNRRSSGSIMSSGPVLGTVSMDAATDREIGDTSSSIFLLVSSAGVCKCDIASLETEEGSQ
jgi:hypothetical protein